MEQHRRTFLKGAGATAFALAPGVRGFERQTGGVMCEENGTCWIEIYRNRNERPLTQSEIATAQRRVVRTYREQSGSSDPVSVGQVGRILEFPVHSFAYTIDAQQRSSFVAGGPEDESDRQPSLTTAEEAVETTTEAEAVETTTAEEAVETTTAVGERETVTPAAETTTAGPDVAARIRSAQRVTEELQETAKRSIPAAAEADLTEFGEVAETTTTDATETNRTTSQPAALAPGTSQQGITVNNFLSLGVSTVKAKAGNIIPRSRLGLDLTSPPRRAHHLVVQDFNIQPNWRQKWQIQSAEVVHDWRSPRTRGINVVSHAPAGGRNGFVTKSVTIGASGPSATWTYSQPDVSREGHAEGPKMKWQWHWNRGGLNSSILTVGSVASGNRPARKGDHLVVVRSGVTFRKLPNLRHPRGQKQKLRVVQAFRYE